MPTGVYIRTQEHHDNKKAIETRKIKKRIGFMIPPLWLCECDDPNCKEILFNGRHYVMGHIWKGKHPSKECIEKLSKIRKGRPSGRKGKKHKPESIEKISKNHRDMKGKKNHMFGKPKADGAGHCKKYYYNSPFQGVVCLKGSYEYKLALYLDRNNILWLYEPKAFPMTININGKDKETTYRPDFLLLRESKFIEVKGYLDEEHRIKMDKFREIYKFNLEVLRKDDLQKLGIDLRKI